MKKLIIILSCGMAALSVNAVIRITPSVPCHIEKLPSVQYTWHGGYRLNQDNNFYLWIEETPALGNNGLVDKLDSHHIEQDSHIFINYSYDINGRIVEKTMAEGQIENGEWIIGAPLSQATNNQYFYNAEGDLTMVKYLTYNEGEYRCTMVNSYTYDEHEHYIRMQQSHLSQVCDQIETPYLVIDYTYNEAGQIIAADAVCDDTYMAGHYDYSYDAEGRVISCVQHTAEGDTEHLYRYNDYGDLIYEEEAVCINGERQLSDYYEHSYTYDEQGRISTHDRTRWGENMVREEFRYEAPTALEEAAAEHEVTKRIENGRLIILRDGIRYDIFGNKF